MNSKRQAYLAWPVSKTETFPLEGKVHLVLESKPPFFFIRMLDNFVMNGRFGVFLVGKGLFHVAFLGNTRGKPLLHLELHVHPSGRIILPRFQRLEWSKFPPMPGLVFQASIRGQKNRQSVLTYLFGSLQKPPFPFHLLLEKH